MTNSIRTPGLYWGSGRGERGGGGSFGYVEQTTMERRGGECVDSAGVCVAKRFVTLGAAAAHLWLNKKSPCIHDLTKPPQSLCCDWRRGLFCHVIGAEPRGSVVMSQPLFLNAG